MVNAQEWLDQNYPKEKREQITFLGIWDKKLTGELNLTGFINLKEFYCMQNQLASLDLSDCVKLEHLGCWDNQLTKLDLSSSFNLKGLSCGDNQLTELDVSNCSNLEVLGCGINNLINLDLTNCSQLTELYCQENQLTQLTLPTKLPNLEHLICRDNLLTNLDFTALNDEKLTSLSLQSNNLPAQDLSYLARFINCKELWLGNYSQTEIEQNIYNHWTGSLQPLQNMKQLQLLHISNTDLTSGLKYLPPNIIEIYCSYWARPTSQVKSLAQTLEQNNDFILFDSVNQIYLKKQLNPKILKQIKDWSHQQLTLEQETLLANLIISEKWRNHYKKNGLCANCQQLNGDGSWCQVCDVQIWQTNFANWTSGNTQIDKFIQKCQLEATNRLQALEWIPYRQFSNIEHLADGGFSKVHKARWKDLEIILKSLNNSQNITSGFLAEVINTKLVDGNNFSLVVRCYGISQEPETNNYVMVMDYMSEGNLREYLNKNYDQLTFEDKLKQLLDITQGLCSIHQANLIHKDFHSGNVLNALQNNRVFSHISDLGLSKPVNATKESGKIYGVLPYVAPEVLSGQPYSQASDIYSWGMIMYEIFSGLTPYPERDYDTSLAIQICQGLRPNLEPVIIPQLLKDLISRCWDAEPKKRLTVGELRSISSSWFDPNYSIKKNTELYHQHQFLLPAINSLPTKPLVNQETDKYTSKLLDFKNLPKPQNSKEINEQFWNMHGSKDSELNINNLIQELNIQEDPQEQSSTQAQIQIPPK